MATEIIEMGKISSRGQIAIPSEIRLRLGLKDGSKIIFFADDDSIIIKKVNLKSFAEITRPLKESMKNSGIDEMDVDTIISKVRRNKNENSS